MGKLEGRIPLRGGPGSPQAITKAAQSGGKVLFTPKT
jgi:hypothetical protein